MEDGGGEKEEGEEDEDEKKEQDHGLSLPPRPFFRARASGTRR